MATAPVSRKLNLTRDQLAAFLTDQQQIRQFELLFSTVDQLQVITGTDFEYQADTAAATANEALAQISRIAQSLELMALAPRQELGTISSQNSDNVKITGGLISGLDAPLPVASGGIGVTTAAANLVFAGPTTGAAAAPSFRSLVASDIPSLPYAPTSAPVTQTANFSVASTDAWIINNKSGSSCTVTLPTPSTNTGRVLHFQNYQAQTLVSASSNVVPLTGGAATTAILEAVAGANATLVSNGTNWIITQYDSNNALQLE